MQDPVPRIPKIGFKNVGKRVTVTRGGDIIVRPGFFELSVLMRSGGSLTHHLTGNYALALAAVLKSQFFESKRLPEGEAGARALAGALDLGGALVLQGLDLASLEDPTKMPRTSEQPKASKGTKQVRGGEGLGTRARGLLPHGQGSPPGGGKVPASHWAAAAPSLGGAGPAGPRQVGAGHGPTDQSAAGGRQGLAPSGRHRPCVVLPANLEPCCVQLAPALRLNFYQIKSFFSIHKQHVPSGGPRAQRRPGPRCRLGKDVTQRGIHVAPALAARRLRPALVVSGE